MTAYIFARLARLGRSMVLILPFGSPQTYQGRQYHAAPSPQCYL